MFPSCLFICLVQKHKSNNVFPSLAVYLKLFIDPSLAACLLSPPNPHPTTPRLSLV